MIDDGPRLEYENCWGDTGGFVEGLTSFEIYQKTRCEWNSWAKGEIANSDAALVLLVALLRFCVSSSAPQLFYNAPRTTWVLFLVLW